MLRQATAARVPIHVIHQTLPIHSVQAVPLADFEERGFAHACQRLQGSYTALLFDWCYNNVCMIESSKYQDHSRVPLLLLQEESTTQKLQALAS